jgi:hypothetical protein
MYVHPQEIDYNIETLFELIDASGLDFVGFSNPSYWNFERLLAASPELIERAENLGERERYRLIELLDPDISHYEFFLSRPPLDKADWNDDNAILAAVPELNPCIDGFPASSIFNYDYQLVRLSESEIEFMQACDGSLTVKEILNKVQLDLEKVKQLQKQQLIIFSEQ